MTVHAELDPETGKIWISSEWRWKEQIKKIPGAKFASRESKWTVPVSWSACLALRATFQHELELGPNLVKWAANEKETRIDPCLYLRSVTDWEHGDPNLYWWQRS